MNNATNIAPHIAGSSFGQIIMDTIADLKSARARRAVYNATFYDLSALSDKDLSDIGVSRLSIDAISQKAANERA